MRGNIRRIKKKKTKKIINVTLVIYCNSKRVVPTRNYLKHMLESNVPNLLKYLEHVQNKCLENYNEWDWHKTT